MDNLLRDGVAGVYVSKAWLSGVDRTGAAIGAADDVTSSVAMVPIASHLQMCKAYNPESPPNNLSAIQNFPNHSGAEGPPGSDRSRVTLGQLRIAIAQNTFARRDLCSSSFSPHQKVSEQPQHSVEFYSIVLPCPSGQRSVEEPLLDRKSTLRWVLFIEGDGGRMSMKGYKPILIRNLIRLALVADEVVEYILDLSRKSKSNGVKSADYRTSSMVFSCLYPPEKPLAMGHELRSYLGSGRLKANLVVALLSR